MLTKDNTEGFDQATLNTMNEEVTKLLEMSKPEIERHGIDSVQKWAEERTLKKHGGA